MLLGAVQFENKHSTLFGLPLYSLVSSAFFQHAVLVFAEFSCFIHGGSSCLRYNGEPSLAYCVKL